VARFEKYNDNPKPKLGCLELVILVILVILVDVILLMHEDRVRPIKVL